MIIQYFELSSDRPDQPHMLGFESYSGIQETLIALEPNLSASKSLYPVFLTKRFELRASHVWRLHAIERISPQLPSPAIFKIYLWPHDVTREEFLFKTLRKNPCVKIHKLIRQGTLVEVDFGFVQQVARASSEVRSNKRYMDTVLFGEMHKRRLAVVTKVISKHIVQVAPVTSSELPEKDKSSFMINRNLLSEMPRYKHSEKNCTVLCSMLQSVSTQRVLPPMSIHRGSVGRNPNYAIVLKGSDKSALKEALVHAVGSANYIPAQDLMDLKKAFSEAETSILTQSAALNAYKSKVRDFDTLQRLAQRWAESMGLTLSEEIAFQEALDAENGL